jgi:hypothetical protein
MLAGIELKVTLLEPVVKVIDSIASYVFDAGIVTP